MHTIRHKAGNHMKIRMSLSSGSIDGAIKELRKYKKTLSQKAGMVAKELADRGRDKAAQNVREYATYGNLQDIAASIRVKQVKGKYRIYTANRIAPFVEFGTGVRGRNDPHPNAALMAWAYVTGSKFTWYNGEYGWWYPTTADDLNPTAKQTETGDWIAFTTGMPSRPFMHDAYLWLKSQKGDIARSVFK